MDKNNEIVKSTLYLPKEMHTKLKIESVVKGVSMRMLVEKILKEYFDGNDRPN